MHLSHVPSPSVLTARCIAAIFGALIGCSPTTDRVRTATTDAPLPSPTESDSGQLPAETDAPGALCPSDMVAVEDFCIDRYEAPNQAGALPLVMYHYYESQDWCEARGKRLCFDDEWTRACEGTAAHAYPYGNTHQPGVCNDDEIWRPYDGSLLGQWPGNSLPTDDYTDLASLLTDAHALNASAAEHVEWLYQGEGGGDNAGCGGDHGVYDLLGNVEEWTTRRDGGEGPDFSGNLKGRFWSESRTCQGNVRVHGNAFRFYEIGFRCCSDQSATP